MKSPRSLCLVLVLALCLPMPTEAFIANLFNIIISIFIPNWQVGVYRMMRASRIFVMFKLVGRAGCRPHLAFSSSSSGAILYRINCATPCSGAFRTTSSTTTPAKSTCPGCFFDVDVGATCNDDVSDSRCAITFGADNGNLLTAVFFSAWNSILAANNAISTRWETSPWRVTAHCRST
jgi:hypothetical protein